MRSPGNVAEFAGTTDSTAVAEQQSRTLSSETDWPKMTESLFQNRHVIEQCGSITQQKGTMVPLRG